MAILNGRWCGYGKTPHRAVADAVRKAKPELPDLKAVVACIESFA